MDAWIGAATDAIVAERQRVYQAEQVRIRSAHRIAGRGGAGGYRSRHTLAADPVDRLALVVAPSAYGFGRGGGAASPGRRRALVHSGSGQRTNAAIRNQRRDGLPLGDNRSSAARRPQSRSCACLRPLVVGIGESHPGPDGFRRAFLEASDALRLAASLGHNGGVSYGDAALAIVLSRYKERARWFVEHELRDLAADSPEMADMRNTLQTFFAYADAHRSGSGIPLPAPQHTHQPARADSGRARTRRR